MKIPGGFNDEDLVKDWEKTYLWAYLNMQIIQEWRICFYDPEETSLQEY